MLLKDISLSAVVAGFVAVLVGYLSSVAIIFQAAEAAGASPEQISSWLGALGIAMGVTSIGLSLYFRAPVVTAWSTPGAALLVTSVVGVPMPEIIGAFVLSAVLIILCGATGWFERVMDRIPTSIAAAMLAGILLRFGMNVFTSMETELRLPLVMFLVFLVLRRIVPVYAVVLTLLAGVLFSGWTGFRYTAIDLAVATPVLVVPQFSWQSVIGIGLPLFAVTMASQNIPGIATMRAAGYKTPVSPLITWTGVTQLLLAPFGCFGVNMAAIIAAICMGDSAHRDPDKRYVASVSAGGFYLLFGIFGATVGAALASVPEVLVLTIAGLALFGTIGNSLSAALHDEAQREPALITFLVTASGISLFGIGAAFWGLVAGLVALLVNWLFKR